MSAELKLLPDPARDVHLSDQLRLPPIYLAAAALDPLLDDSVEFARRLKRLNKVGQRGWSGQASPSPCRLLSPSRCLSIVIYYYSHIVCMQRSIHSRIYANVHNFSLM